MQKIVEDHTAYRPSSIIVHVAQQPLQSCGLLLMVRDCMVIKRNTLEIDLYFTWPDYDSCVICNIYSLLSQIYTYSEVTDESLWALLPLNPQVKTATNQQVSQKTSPGEAPTCPPIRLHTLLSMTFFTDSIIVRKNSKTQKDTAPTSVMRPPRDPWNASDGADEKTVKKCRCRDIRVSCLFLRCSSLWVTP